MARLPFRRGFTLIELLVVIGIISVLIGLLLAAVMRVRAAAARTQCLNNQRQLGMALHHYHDAHGVLPPGCSFQDGKDPHPHVSWCVRLTPYLEQPAIWPAAQRAFEQERFFLRPPHHPLLATVLRVFVCPADGRIQSPRQMSRFKMAFTSYLGVEGTDQFKRDGLLYLDSKVRFSQVTDGTSVTILLGERPPSADFVAGWWYAGWGQDKDGSAEMVLGVKERNVNRYYRTPCPPGPYEFSPGQFNDLCAAFHFWSPHAGGGHFCFADGSARFLAYSAAPLMPALATRAGGEAVSLPE